MYYTTALLNNFQAKVAQCLHEMEDIYMQSTIELAKRIAAAGAKIIASIVSQAYQSMAFGAMTSVFSFGGALAPTQAGRRTAEAWKNVFGAGDKTIGTFKQATQQKLQQESDLHKNQLLPQANKKAEDMKNEYYQFKKQIEDIASKESASPGYHSRG